MGEEAVNLSQFVRRSKISVAWTSKNEWAFLDTEDNVCVNVPLFLVSCVVHEWLHFKYPKLTERQVALRERKMVDRMTARQILRMARKIARKVSDDS